MPTSFDKHTMLSTSPFVLMASVLVLFSAVTSAVPQPAPGYGHFYSFTPSSDDSSSSDEFSSPDDFSSWESDSSPSDSEMWMPDHGVTHSTPSWPNWDHIFKKFKTKFTKHITHKKPTPLPVPDDYPEESSPTGSSDDSDDEESAPSGGSKPSGSWEKQILDCHNSRRRSHSAKDLVWDSKIASDAKKHSQSCVFAHSNNQLYGENIAMGMDSAEAVLKAWVDDEQQYYTSPVFSMQAGHYTQCLWKSTKYLGCGYTDCPNGRFVVCNYKKPGNVQGQFEANVS